MYCDNLFTSMDLLDAMGDRQLGVTGTLRQNRIIGIPLPSKKVAEKEFKRGDVQAVYCKDSTVIVWKDNKPVFMASNFDQVEPVGQCQRFSQKEKKYVNVPQPNINATYNRSMGGVDLVDNAEKCYAITTRVKKWYWCIYTWYLNVCMVQAWRLYRAHWRERSRLVQEQEKVEEAEWEREMLDSSFLKATIDQNRRERQRERRKKRAEEKKVHDIPLLDFTRQVVDLTMKKHAAEANKVIGPQSEASVPAVNLIASNKPLFRSTLEVVRYDNGRHLVRKTSIKGVCQQCHKRSLYRCIRCQVALHPEECFYRFHVPEGEWEDV